MPLVPETRALLEQLDTRLAYVVERELVLLTAPAAPPPVEFTLPDFLRKAEPPYEELRESLGHPKLPSRISGLLPVEFFELLWSELTEHLFESERCHFDGLGEFEVRDYRDVTVEFRPYPTLALQEPFAVAGEESLYGTAFQVCAEAFGPLRDHWAIELTAQAARNRTSTLEGFASSLLLLGLPALRQILQRHKHTASTETFISSLSVAAYYSGIMALAFAIGAWRKVTIPAVGTFQIEFDSVSFEASSQLIALLSVNLSVKA